MFAQTLDGQPISAGIGSSQQQAYQSLAESLNLGSTGPRVYTDTGNLRLRVMRSTRWRLMIWTMRRMRAKQRLRRRLKLYDVVANVVFIS